MSGAKGRSGGLRVGAGRKPVAAETLALRGGRSRRPRPVVSVTPVAEVSIPDDLPEDQRAVWESLAPHVVASRTLTPETAAAFRDLCEAIVVKRAMLAQITRDGMTLVDVSVDGAGVEHQSLKAHPLLGKHQGMMVRVEQGMARFLLTPSGKPVTVAEVPKDEWAEFESPLSLVKKTAP